jgi:hypothetical protein
MDMLLQIDPAGLMDTAKNVTPNDGSGYSFAILVLTFILLISLWALKKLHEENKLLQTSAVTRAEDMTKNLILATNAQERAFEKVAEKLETQTDLLKEIKASKA